MALSLTSVRAESSVPIITRFYDLLTGENIPSEEQETEFFGTKSSMRGLLQNARKWPIKVPETLYKYEHSKTPVWDYLRDHKDLFLPFGSNAFNDTMLYSEPFSYIKAGKKQSEQWVDVIFISNLHNPKAGFRSVKVSLGEKVDECLINIDSTLLRGFDGYSIPDYASRVNPPDIFRLP